MFGRLSKACSRLVEYDGGGLSLGRMLQDSEGVASSSSIGSTSSSAIESVATTCGKLLDPLCRYAHSTFTSNVDAVVLSLAQADPDFLAHENMASDEDEEDIYVIPFPPSIDSGISQASNAADGLEELLPDSIVVLSCSGGVADGSDEPQARGVSIPIPSIVLTPAPPQSREMSSCVPVQDTCFGARLAVPSHSALNAAHPPMMLPTHIPPPVHPAMCAWTYKHGHWCAVAPGLDEQERRGLFSRPIGMRRRGMRKRAAYARDVSLVYQNTLARTKREPQLSHLSSHLL